MKPFLKTAYYLILIAALYPVSFLSYNRDYFGPGAMFLGLAASFILTLFLYALFLALTRRAFGALLLTLMATCLFWVAFGFSYNHLVDAIGIPANFRNSLSQFLLLILLYPAGLFMWWGYRKCAPFLSRPGFHKFFAIFLHGVLLLPLFSLGASEARNMFAWETTASSRVGQQAMPDIYYVIVDAYGRWDIFRTMYHYDEGPFFRFLKQKGFYIAYASHSNYGQTELSLASSLNLDYVDHVIGKLPPKTSQDRWFLDVKIRHSLVREALVRRGYRFVAIDSGFGPTEIRDAGTYIQPQETSYCHNNLEFLDAMLNSSPIFLFSAVLQSPKDTSHWFFDAQDWLHDFLNCYTYGDLMVWRFMALKHSIDLPGPKFVFAHFTSPHPPLIFQPNDPLDRYTERDADDRLVDGSDYTHDTPEGIASYITGYSRQVAYVNRQLEDFVRQVLARRPNSVIIIQGDHGPGSHLNWYNIAASNLPERLSNLSVFYFPDHDYRTFSPFISPVNIFRVVFNHYLGTKFSMLPFHSYMSPWRAPYKFLDATQILYDWDVKQHLRRNYGPRPLSRHK